jgi:hypothetical protein
MRKRPIKPWPDIVAERVTELLKGNDRSRAILNPAVCMTCGAAWLLRKDEDSQFSHVPHGCRRGQHYNVRIMVERIGSTRDERDELGRAYRAVIK